MRPEKKFTRNEISFRHENSCVHFSFHRGQNKMKFCFGGGRSETAH